MDVLGAQYHNPCIATRRSLCGQDLPRQRHHASLLTAQDLLPHRHLLQTPEFTQLEYRYEKTLCAHWFSDLYSTEAFIVGQGYRPPEGYTPTMVNPLLDMNYGMFSLLCPVCAKMGFTRWHE